MGRPEFGVMLRQQKIDFEEIKATAQLCDSTGYDSVWFYDHVLGQGIIENRHLRTLGRLCPPSLP